MDGSHTAVAVSGRATAHDDKCVVRAHQEAARYCPRSNSVARKYRVDDLGRHEAKAHRVTAYVCTQWFTPMHRRTHTLSIVSDGVEDAPEVCFCPVLSSMFLATDDPLPSSSNSLASSKKLREE